MSHTNSLPWPNMFDVARNKVGVIDDNVSVVNRTKLLMLTDPTALYNEPTFGVGMRKYLFQYNNDNIMAMIEDKIKEQLELYEPSVDAEETQFSKGLLYSDADIEDEPTYQDAQRLKMTVGLRTTYGENVKLELENIGTLTEV